MTNMDSTSLTLSKLALAWLILTPGLAGAETTNKFEPGQLREDFQIVRQSLEEGHPGLYRQTKKIELDRVFDNAEKSLNYPMDFYEFYRLMAPTIARSNAATPASVFHPMFGRRRNSRRGFLST